MKKKNRNIYRMIYIALLVAQAMVVFKLEELIPVPFPAVPGAKLGLANIFTLVSLYTLDPFSTFVVVALRSILSMVIGSNPAAFLYSISGVVLAFLFMWGLKSTLGDRLSRIGISVAGAFAHNLGQLLAAAILVSAPRILVWLPALTLLAIPTGFFVGVTANFMLEHLSRMNIMKELKRG
ncbi:hypothetical protein ABB02_01237 [Clostridiaceae bacterium JG1575]|nr:hypothetical protein ABB02_01237 [Clostridiaceae bacterium JG1575]